MIFYESLLTTWYNLTLVIGNWSLQKWENCQKRCKFHYSTIICVTGND